MKIRGKDCIVYDVEIFRDIFHVTLYNTETKTLYKFEVSKRKNEIRKLCSFFVNTSAYFVGYNNHHYDDIIINYCLQYFYNDKYKWYQICESLFNLTNIIINENNLDRVKKWKYNKPFFSLDLLTLLYSQQLRVSLKELQVTMHYKNVQEFVCDWKQPLGEELFDEMIDYNINDVMSTTELLNRCIEDIELRIEVEDSYNIDCLSKDGVNLGMEILKQEYLRHTGLQWWQIKDLRSPADMINLKDVILPLIKYENPTLRTMLDIMKSSTVSPGRKGFEYKFLYNNLEYSVGVGGIHTKNKPEIFIPKDDEVLADYDVASLYPSLMLQYNFYPRHLGKEFGEVYGSIKEKRMAAKRAEQKNKDTTFKLALNGLTGNLQNEFSWVYDPFAVMQIRINGQLLLLMLAEKLIEIGVEIIQANTDGLFMRYKKTLQSEVDRVNSEWEKLTGLVLDGDFFSAFYQMAVNDYFAVPINGDIKEKGMFITDVKLGKGLKPKIIPKAIIAFFKDNIPIEDTIYNCTDIKDFLMSEKTGKQWEVEYNGKIQQRINRFYASTNGAYLYKKKLRSTNPFDFLAHLKSTVGYNITESDYIKTEREYLREWENKPLNERLYQYNNMLSDSGVTLLNKFDNKPINERKINYRYYIKECYKIIRELKPLQLTLW